MNKITKNAGFTLLETLIAMFVFLIIMIFLYFTFNATQKARTATLKSGKPGLEALHLYNILHLKITELNYTRPYFIATGGKNMSSLYFTGLSHNPSVFTARSSFENINYFYTKKIKNKNYYELIYKETYYKTNSGHLIIFDKKAVLAKNLAYFKIRYYYNGRWLKKFNYLVYDSFPEAVKMEYGIDDKKFKFVFNLLQ